MKTINILLQIVAYCGAAIACFQFFFPYEYQKIRGKMISQSKKDQNWQWRGAFTGIEWMQFLSGVILLLIGAIYPWLYKQVDLMLTAMCIYWGFAFMVLSILFRRIADSLR